MNLGNVIAKFRKAKNVESKAMADSLGISATYLSLIETNKKKPSPEMLSAIADYFDIPVSVFLFQVLEAKDFKKPENREIFESAKPLIDGILSLLITDIHKIAPQKRGLNNKKSEVKLVLE